MKYKKTWYKIFLELKHNVQFFSQSEIWLQHTTTTKAGITDHLELKGVSQDGEEEMCESKWKVMVLESDSPGKPP